MSKPAATLSKEPAPQWRRAVLISADALIVCGALLMLLGPWRFWSFPDQAPWTDLAFAGSLCGLTAFAAMAAGGRCLPGEDEIAWGAHGLVTAGLYGVLWIQSDGSAGG